MARIIFNLFLSVYFSYLECVHFAISQSQYQGHKNKLKA